MSSTVDLLVQGRFVLGHSVGDVSSRGQFVLHPQNSIVSLTPVLFLPLLSVRQINSLKTAPALQSPPPPATLEFWRGIRARFIRTFGLLPEYFSFFFTSLLLHVCRTQEPYCTRFIGEGLCKKTTSEWIFPIFLLFTFII